MDGNLGYWRNGLAVLERSIGIDCTTTARRSRASFKAVILGIAVVASSLIISGTLWYLVIETAPPERPNADTFAYVTHAPIIIEGNDGFLGDNSTTGISSGDGTESDPYVIEGWEISGVDTYWRSCIRIRGSDVHFVIRHCSIRDASGDWDYGVFLDCCLNGTISHNYFTNNNYAIKLETWNGDDRASQNSVTNNTCIGNTAGVIATYMCELDISNNTCCNNDWGIAIGSNSKNRIANNTCTDGTRGIWAMITNDNEFVGNNCSSNAQYGFHLYRTSGNTIRNNNISHNGIGMRFWPADWQGLSADNMVHSNLIEENVAYGILMQEGNMHNRIWNNSFAGNNGATDVYNPLNVQAMDNGTANWWNSTDGYGNYWSDWTMPDNDYDWIVDVPYELAGTAAVSDEYPRTTVVTAIPEFSSPGIAVVITLGIVALFVAFRRR